MPTSKSRALRRAGLQPRVVPVTVAATFTPYDKEAIESAAYAAARLDVHKERTSRMRCDDRKKDHVLPRSVPDKRLYHDSTGIITRTQDKLARDASADKVYTDAYEVGVSHWRETDTVEPSARSSAENAAYIGHARRKKDAIALSTPHAHAPGVEGLPVPTPRVRPEVQTLPPKKRPACAIAKAIVHTPVLPRSTF